MNNKKTLKKLKDQYFEIEIPKEIDVYINNGIIKGKLQLKKEKRKAKQIKWFGSIAAVFIAFVISINTIPSFAAATCDIPGLGKLVKILKFEKNIGHGGIITDGTDVNLISMQKYKDYENIIINFSNDTASHFDIYYREYPYTLIFSVSGARHFSAQNDLKLLKQSSFIKDAYPIITLDDSMIRFALTFNKPFNYEVTEYKEPAQIVVKISPKKEIPKHEIYSIRSKSYINGEELGLLEETFLDLEGTRILKDRKGYFCVEIGYFNSIDEAQKNLEELKDKYPILSQFYIEKRNALDLPEHTE
ncbi:DUF4179 domain-containing protein [Crassaminicella thermophila]|uniref:DUF4179 domain-containing protein n=1 Tax=Crassaminicella thermophila TaxID=2599308 RepID=A0A5C0SCM5_CRATE|nr:DUF4179 domain-containing protein [Crassaminicella thermophila]QEK10954.1 DUF4179 domain-containing protein [Crassaminicella thermophila]